MRLHNALAGYGEHFDNVQQVNDLRAIYKDAVAFDFGDVTPIPDNEWKDLQIYALELSKAKLFALPFKTVSYSLVIDGKSYCVVADTVSEDKIRFWTLLENPASKTPLGAETTFNATLSRSTGKCVTLDPDIFANAYDADTMQPVFPEQELSRVCRNLVQDALAMTVMLQADGVIQQTTPAPSKLNVRRVKAGKLPINAITEIRIKVGNSTAHASGVRTGNGHASPRCHWRRGHLRKLPDGKLTNVRPCLVGAIGNETVAPKDYSVAQ